MGKWQSVPPCNLHISCSCKVHGSTLLSSFCSTQPDKYITEFKSKLFWLGQRVFDDSNNNNQVQSWVTSSHLIVFTILSIYFSFLNELFQVKCTFIDKIWKLIGSSFHFWLHLHSLRYYCFINTESVRLCLPFHGR